MEGKKLFIIIGGVLLALILAVTLIFVFKGKDPQGEVVESPPLQSNPVDTQSPAPSDNQLAGNPLEEDTDKENNSTVINLEDSIQDGEIEVTHPEIDWEEPPVITIYNADADTNSDGHVDKSEWEEWVGEDEAGNKVDIKEICFQSWILLLTMGVVVVPVSGWPATEGQAGGRCQVGIRRGIRFCYARCNPPPIGWQNLGRLASWGLPRFDASRFALAYPRGRCYHCSET